MRIADVLRSKGGSVTTVAGSCTVEELLALLVDRNIGSVVVVSPAGDLVGMVGERDIVHGLRQRGSTLQEPVSTIMNVAVTCHPDDTVDATLATMTDRRTRHLPVVEDGRLVGLVSIGDLVKSRIEDLSHERDQMSAYISGDSA